MYSSEANIFSNLSAAAQSIVDVLAEQAAAGTQQFRMSFSEPELTDRTIEEAVQQFNAIHPWLLARGCNATCANELSIAVAPKNISMAVRARLGLHLAAVPV